MSLFILPNACLHPWKDWPLPDSGSLVARSWFERLVLGLSRTLLSPTKTFLGEEHQNPEKWLCYLYLGCILAPQQVDPGI